MSEVELYSVACTVQTGTETDERSPFALFVASYSPSHPSH